MITITRKMSYSGLIFASIVLLSLFSSDSAHSQTTFDHFSTGFILDGAHTNVTCEGCHVGGTFGPTNSACSSCHSESSLVRASSKPANHVATNGECSDCHITGTPETFSCLGACHEHTPDRMADKHSEVEGYAYDFDLCVACHPDGRD